MSQVDTLSQAVKSRLDLWGRTFALYKDRELLGHQSVNMLQILIDHKGEMPAKATGYKPMEINLDALQVELLVTDIAREDVAMACCLRAYYCGHGRKNAERHQQACELMVKAKYPKIRLGAYIDLVRRAEGIIGRRLVEMKK